MATRSKNLGICLLCKQSIEHRAVTRHLATCLKAHALKPETSNNKAEEIFLIKLTADPLFWLYVEMSASTALARLDTFLRDIWLECCGHLSQFEIKGNSYEGNQMNKAIKTFFKIGDSFLYEYDFGSTTTVEGKISSVRQGYLDEDVLLLARNTMPNVRCATCKRLPKVICTICFDFCCQQCRKKHACGEEEMLLPVVNSPRMGVCGYTGVES